MKHTLLLIAILIATQSRAQKATEYYIAVSSDSIHHGSNLKFIDDSTVELSHRSRHMMPGARGVFKYTATDSTLQILPPERTSIDSHPYGWQMQTIRLTENLNLVKIQEGFIDYGRSIIYVKWKYFRYDPPVYYIIDGKTYRKKMPRSNGTGTVRKIPKTNRALRRKLKNLNKDNYTIELVRGLHAYQRFGVKMVHGVVVIDSKK